MWPKDPNECPYRTCKCKPLCTACGYGKHAEIHSMPETFQGAHKYQPPAPSSQGKEVKP
jgi:hypothetical protein